MILVGCDEADSDLEGRKFSAFTGVEIRDGRLLEFKAALVLGMRQILRRGEHDATPFPAENFHFSHLPPNLTDEQKIALFDLLGQLVGTYFTAVFRVGYYWDADVVKGFRTPDFKSAVLAARFFSLGHLRALVWSLALERRENCLLFWELDRENVDRFHSMFDVQQLLEQGVQMDAIAGKPISAMNPFFLGAYYAPKSDHLMYAADFVSTHLNYAMKENPTEFQRRCLVSLREYRDMVKYDQVHG